MSAGDVPVTKPIPVPDAVTAPFWEAANRGALAIQHCESCEYYIHPPEALCPRCQRPDLAFREVSGRARVYTHTIVRDNVTQGFAEDEPYVIGIIELVEQERLVLVANVVGVAPEDVQIGMPVRVTFERLNEAIALPTKPIPVPDAVTAPFWEAANRGALAIQHCESCEYYIHPPEALCPRCQTPDLAFREVSGRARVYTHTIVRDNVTQGFAEDEPYVIGIIELVEQERLVLVANVVGVAPEDVQIGMPVRVTFERLNEAIALPQFEPAGEG